MWHYMALSTLSSAPVYWHIVVSVKAVGRRCQTTCNYIYIYIYTHCYFKNRQRTVYICFFLYNFHISCMELIWAVLQIKRAEPPFAIPSPTFKWKNDKNMYESPMRKNRSRVTAMLAMNKTITGNQMNGQRSYAEVVNWRGLTLYGLWRVIVLSHFTCYLRSTLIVCTMCREYYMEVIYLCSIFL